MAASTIGHMPEFHAFILEVDNGIFTSSTRSFSSWAISTVKLADVDLIEEYLATTLYRLGLSTGAREELLDVLLEALRERVVIIDWVMLEADRDTAGEEEDFEEVALSEADRRASVAASVDDDATVLSDRALALMMDLAQLAASSEEESDEPHDGWDDDEANDGSEEDDE